VVFGPLYQRNNLDIGYILKLLLLKVHKINLLNPTMLNNHCIRWLEHLGYSWDCLGNNERMIRNMLIVQCLLVHKRPSKDCKIKIRLVEISFKFYYLVLNNYGYMSFKNQIRFFSSYLFIINFMGI
jgi:hypothetical protein